MDHKIRLGPIAIFLVVVAVVLSTLAMLTAATANADKIMAERFARMTEIRYDLEDKGERYLMSVDQAIAEGYVTEETIEAERTEAGNYRHTIENEGYTLTIEITEPTTAGTYEVTEWKVTKDWTADDPFGNIWQG